MQKTEVKNSILYLLWIGFFAAALVLVPGYLGMIIARNQWQMLMLLVLGIGLISLYFSEFRYLIFCSFIVFLFAESGNAHVSTILGTLRWILLGTMSITALFHWIMGRVPSRFRSIDFWAVAFLGLAFYSYNYSIASSLTFERSLATTLLYLAVFWGVWIYVQEERNITIVIHDFLRISFVVFLLGFKSLTHDRFLGLFSNPNSVAAYSTLIAPLALWKYVQDRKKFDLFFLFIVFVSLTLTQSRGGMIGAVVGATYFLIMNKPKKRPVIFMCAVFFLTLFFLYLELFGTSLVREFFRLENFATGSGRFEAWREVWRLIKLRPWLGYGFGTEDQLFARFDIIFMEHTGAYAHNTFLGLVSQVGIIGAFIFFVPLFYFIFYQTYFLNQIPLSEKRSLHLAINASIIAVLALGFFESMIYSAGNPFSFPFWILVVFSYQLSGTYITNEDKI